MSEPKSPRDWLLARHAPATARLDALRRAALPVAPDRARRDYPWRELLRAVFWPSRRTGFAVAGVWILLLAVHLATRRPAPVRPGAPVPAGSFAAWLARIQSHDTLARTDHRP